MGCLTLDRPNDVRCDARDQGCSRPDHPQGLPRRACRRPYLSVGMDRTDARVSPLYADLKGFPPILIQVGAAETLLDDAVRLAAAAGAVASHDPCLAVVERASGGWAPSPRQRRVVYPRSHLTRSHYR